jgi:hypothetical protein
MHARSKLTESGGVSFYSHNTSEVAQRRAARTQIVRGKTMPSPGPCKPRSNEPILEDQGIQFPDIGGVISDELHMSSFTSIAVGRRPQGDHQVPASRLIEGYEQPLPSIESDTIDNLAQRIACSLILLVGWCFQMEVGKGLVYPCQTMLDDVKIDASSYAVVKVDMVHENWKYLKLEVPPDDTTMTMWDTVTIRI